jgi:hypothetical protein
MLTIADPLVRIGGLLENPTQFNRRHDESGRSGLASLPVIEALEDRRLFSVVLPTAPIGVSSVGGTVPISTTANVFQGKVIHAEANQAFEAVVGTINTKLVPPAGYTLQGSIDWGDGTATSAATFVTQANGSIQILGSHTYTATGRDAITIFITEAPPAGTTGPIIVVGRINSLADVISSPRGTTVEETAGVPFTQTVAFFNSNLSELQSRSARRSRK